MTTDRRSWFCRVEHTRGWRQILKGGRWPTGSLRGDSRHLCLSYRLSSNGYLLPVPLLDARRAVQMVRARARDYSHQSESHRDDRLFGGGHLAALAATQPVEGNPEAIDPIERVSSRPDFLVLGYPWIGAISSDTSHLSYCKLFNVMDKCEATARGLLSGPVRHG